MISNYHSKKAEAVIRELDSSERGLEKDEAKKRFNESGPNDLPKAKTEGWLMIFLRQFQSPLIFILLAAAAIVFLTGEKTDSLVILFILFFNAAVGAIQEGRAQNIFLALNKFVKTSASVIRDGQEYIISDREVVVGDILVLREGEKVPADARLISAESLETDEAALTGESKPKFKSAETVEDQEAAAADQHNMVFKGTNVVAGLGRAVVVGIGKNTIIGSISQKIMGIDEELPLKNSIRRLSLFIIISVGVLSFIMLALGIYWGHNLREIFYTIVSVSVSIIPEGLPIVITLVLARGVWRMGKRNILVKRMQAVEALGQMSILAVDKTGTVTKNELTVREIYVDGKLFRAEGIGYDPKGEIRSGGEIIDPLNHPELLFIGKVSALGSSANLAYAKNSGKWKMSGDPTEASMLVLAEKIGFNREDLEKELPKIDEFPFDYNLKYHATLHQEKNSSVPNNLLAVAGAPEKILTMAEKIWHQGQFRDLSGEEKEEIKKIFLKMSRQGLRVVSLGVKYLDDKERIPETISSLAFIGLLGIEDAPREEVVEAVKKVKSAGIKLAMITGDHEITARSIAEETGIFRSGEKIINGEELDQMEEEELSKKLDNVSVFARVTPLHKLKIINAYKLKGETVAMTGDGVNDALSLASADVGVAMGKIGTEVAREASDIVLTDDNFGNIVAGVEEGRNILRTIRRVILYLFSTSLGEVFTIILAIAAGLPLPILAVQILWLNLVTDGFLDVSLAMEPKSEGLSNKNYSRKKPKLVDTLMIKRMFLMALPMVAGTLLLFSFYYKNDISKAWTISLTTLAVFQWFNAWNCRSSVESIFHSNPFSNRYLLGAMVVVISLQVLAVYNPIFQKILRTVSLSGKEWIMIIAVAFSVVIIEEIRKLIYRRR